MVIWMMIGIPGSGKSTWIKNHMNYFKGKTEIISRDAIRFSIVKEDEEYFSHETEVFNTFINKIQSAINEKCDNIVIDATHLNRGSRDKVFSKLKNYNEYFINSIVLNTSVESCIKRNSNRMGRELVPEKSIRNMANSFSFPSREEFDKIYEITEEGTIYLQ